MSRMSLAFLFLLANASRAMRLPSSPGVALHRPSFRASSRLATSSRRRTAPQSTLLENVKSIAAASSTLAVKGLDTVEDAVLHLRRLNAEPTPVFTADRQQEEEERDKRRRIVVLGAGWGAHALMKVIDANAFRVTVVSPRDHFLFTPMLAATAVGTVEYRSIIESVRAANPLIEFVEGTAVDVDPRSKQVSVRLSPLLHRPTVPEHELHEREHDGRAQAPRLDAEPEALAQAATQPQEPQQLLSLSYDTLVVACGARVSLSAVPGALNRCYRLKEVEDARELRRGISEAFARAARKGLSSKEVERLLTFVVVGGGPTGVELSGELTDLLSSDVRLLYPALAGRARVLLVHGGSELLPPFEPSLRQAAAEGLTRRGVTLILNSRVENVGDTSLTIRTKRRAAPAEGGSAGSGDGTPLATELPYGLVVWCAGTSPQPIVGTLLEKLPPSARSQDGRLNVDKWLRVRMRGSGADSPAGDVANDGSDGGSADPAFGSIFAIGDAAYETFEADDDSPAAKLAVARSFARQVRQEPGSSAPRGDGAAEGAAAGAGAAPAGSTAEGGTGSARAGARSDDAGPKKPKPLPQTAQVAAQQGAFVARMINRNYNLTLPQPALADEPLSPGQADGLAPVAAGGARWWLIARGVGTAPPFAFLNLGILAFIGGGEALAQVQLGDLTLLKEAGSVGFLLWRSVYIVKQVAVRNRVLVTFDWLKTQLFGRDLTRF